MKQFSTSSLTNSAYGGFCFANEKTFFDPKWTWCKMSRKGFGPLLPNKLMSQLWHHQQDHHLEAHGTLSWPAEFSGTKLLKIIIFKESSSGAWLTDVCILADVFDSKVHSDMLSVYKILSQWSRNYLHEIFTISITSTYASLLQYDKYKSQTIQNELYGLDASLQCLFGIGLY